MTEWLRKRKLKGILLVLSNKKDMITDADIKKLSNTFATKDDLKELKQDFTRLENSLDQRFENIDQKFEGIQFTIEKMYTLLDKTFGNQEDFKVDFILLNDQVQRHEQILQGMT